MLGVGIGGWLKVFNVFQEGGIPKSKKWEQWGMRVRAKFGHFMRT